MPYPTSEWPEGWAIRGMSTGRLRLDRDRDPTALERMPDGNLDPTMAQRNAQIIQANEARGHIRFDDITLRSEQIRWNLEPMEPTRTINWIQVYRSRNFVPPLDLFPSLATRKEFIRELTENEPNVLSNTEWEPLLQTYWIPPIPISAAEVHHLHRPLSGDNTAAISWFDTFYHFQIVPRQHHTQKVMYFIFKRKPRLVYGSRVEMSPRGPVTWTSPYHTHGVRETHFVVSIGSIHVTGVTSIRIDADETNIIQSEIKRQLTIFRPSRTLYSVSLDKLNFIGYPSPPLTQYSTPTVFIFVLFTVLSTAKLSYSRGTKSNVLKEKLLLVVITKNGNQIQTFL